MHDQPPQSAPYDAEPRIPTRLAADLHAAYRADRVPASIDAAILREAGRQMRGRRRRRLVLLTAGPLAAAAGLAVAVWLLPQARQGGPGGAATATAVAIRGDLNGDARVDIIDALLLANAIQAGVDLNAAWDLTGDGAITQADVDAIAASAVRLASSGGGGGDRGQEGSS